MEIEKLIVDGKVAVLVSHGYGAGWSTWNGDDPGLIFDKTIVEHVQSGDKEAAVKRAEEIYKDGYFGGIDGLTVEWVTQGMAFEITEYDGSESLKVIGEQTYHIA